MKLVILCCKYAPFVVAVMPKRKIKMSRTIVIGWSTPMYDLIYVPANFIKYLYIKIWHRSKFKVRQCTEVHFASFFSGGFTTMTVINPLERKLAKRTSVHCFNYDWKGLDMKIYDFWDLRLVNSFTQMIYKNWLFYCTWELFINLHMVFVLHQSDFSTQ